ncbi:DUF4232 domain-containing protein [Streptacidiphilus sp. N1-10]|uniref:DUF4232 domain-containing protein n=1 Tax=Streptacidiphilus jeojiensis TaxID=3229225 RepID=A0ABV6XKG2_9ACTN
MRTQTRLLVVVTAGVALAASACTSSPTPRSTPSGSTPSATAPSTTAASTGTPSTGTTAAAPSSAPASTPPATTTTAAAPVGTTAPATVTQGVPACTGGQIKVTPGQWGGATGHIGGAVLFRNTSRSTCSLYGYPGVAGLDSAGRQEVQATRVPRGFIGGLPTPTSHPTTVVLAPGAVASAVIEGVDVPSGNATSCPNYPSILVTPPGTRSSTHLALAVPGCGGIQVHPVVPGTSGGQL